MRKQAKFMGAVLLLLLVGTACSSVSAEPTVVVLPTNIPPPSATNGLPTVDSDNHTHAPDEPDHIHLDDGSTLTTEGVAPLQEDIWSLLLAGDPIVVGEANESLETAVLTIPTMF